MNADIRLEVLLLRKAELEAQLAVVTAALEELGAGPQVSPEQSEPEPEPAAPPPPPRVAMCANGCMTWEEGEHEVCPSCGGAEVLYPQHLQPVGEVTGPEPGDLAAEDPRPKAVTLETVRDFAVRHRGLARFSTSSAAQYFKCSQETVRQHLEHLASLGTIKRELSLGGRGRWWSCPEIEEAAPTHHPREPLHVPGQGEDRAGNGSTIPGTGKPMGRSGKPGQDKRNSATKRVVG